MEQFLETLFIFDTYTLKMWYLTILCRLCDSHRRVGQGEVPAGLAHAPPPAAVIQNQQLFINTTLLKIYYLSYIMTQTRFIENLLFVIDTKMWYILDSL